MGMDVYIDGELTIPASKVLEARDLFLKVLAKGGCNYAHNDEPWTPGEHDTYETPKEIVGLIKGKLERFGIELCDDGSIEFRLEDSSTRHEEYDQWIFEILAPVIEDGQFSMSGDEYHWMWVIEGGEFSESHGEIVYDHDSKATPTIEKIIEMIYPHDGKPLSATCDDPNMFNLVINNIENLLRETGYGPQAGKNELDRLSEV